MILTELLHNKNKRINLHASVLSNFNTVLLQFYAQFYSNSIQIYHCKNYINKFILLAHHQTPAKKFVQRLKNNLHIEVEKHYNNWNEGVGGLGAELNLLKT